MSGTPAGAGSAGWSGYLDRPETEAGGDFSTASSSLAKAAFWAKSGRNGAPWSFWRLAGSLKNPESAARWRSFSPCSVRRSDQGLVGGGFRRGPFFRGGRAEKNRRQVEGEGTVQLGVGHQRVGGLGGAVDLTGVGQGAGEHGPQNPAPVRGCQGDRLVEIGGHPGGVFQTFSGDRTPRIGFFKQRLRVGVER